PHPRHTLLPYTTLFRSGVLLVRIDVRRPGEQVEAVRVRRPEERIEVAVAHREGGVELVVERQLLLCVVAHRAPARRLDARLGVRSEEHTSELQSRGHLV